MVFREVIQTAGTLFLAGAISLGMYSCTNTNRNVTYFPSGLDGFCVLEDENNFCYFGDGEFKCDDYLEKTSESGGRVLFSDLDCDGRVDSFYKENIGVLCSRDNLNSDCSEEAFKEADQILKDCKEDIDYDERKRVVRKIKKEREKKINQLYENLKDL